MLAAFCLLVLFSGLGGAALFEPDEGRNAEKAREIVVLGDWMTPHENFFPVLDKPIFFYWLIAGSFKLFGISEWSARLPSALAALGCVVLLYRWVRAHWGFWEALWSTLVLVTSVEFFILSRIVIVDMTLTFSITLALLSFFSAAQSREARLRRYRFLAMYGAIGFGMLVKGPIAILIPGMIIFFYLLLAKKWWLVGQMNLLVGAALLILIAAPWYLAIESRNPGYLRYFFWEENFGRFVTGEFNRTRSWYYFLIVLAVGFLPWSFFVPVVLKDFRKALTDERRLFLTLWVVLPLVFFSASKAKLPQYILPIFPALSVLTADSLLNVLTSPASKKKQVLHLPWAVQLVTVFYLILGSVWPDILPVYIRHAVGETAFFIWLWAVVLLLVYICFSLLGTTDNQKRLKVVYGCHAASLVFFMLFAGRLMTLISYDRSAKPVAAEVVSLAWREHQVVFYDTYLRGMPFYLRADRPIWVVLPEGKKRTFLGNFYLIEQRPRPSSVYGEAMFTFEEFREEWRKTTRPLLIIVKEKNFRRMTDQIGIPARELAKVDEYLLATNR